MILNLGRKSKKLTKAEKERKARLKRSLKASTQNTIKYNSLFENGLMHIAKMNGHEPTAWETWLIFQPIRMKRLT